jgi:uncharacterized membrane protein YqjE
MEAPAEQAPPDREPQAQAAPLRGLLAAGLEAVRTRIDLAAVELEIHLLTLIRMLVCVVGVVACALLAFAFAVTAMIVALWDTHRMLGLLVGTFTFIALSVGFGYFGARTLRSGPGFLEGSLHQLSEDQRRVDGGAP